MVRPLTQATEPRACLQIFEREVQPPNALLDTARVVHDDESLCVLVKPEGAYTHGHGAGRSRKSLTHVITRLVAPSPRRDALPRPSPAHRLDKGTGGLIIFVKTLAAAQALEAQFGVAAQRAQAVRAAGHATGRAHRQRRGWG